MPKVLLAAPKAQFFDDEGDPLAAGQLYVYGAGTSTLTTTWSDSGGTSPNANPVILDSAGRPDSGAIYLTAGIGYKFILQDADSVQIWSQDNVILEPDESGAGGDVVGPAGATDNGLVRFNGTTGQLIQDTSGPTLEDDGRIATVTDPTDAQDAATKAYVDEAIAALGSGGGEIAQNSFLVSGGQVVWQSAYIFLVSAATYYIDGVLYTSPQTSVTLDAAHATLDRIDAIVVTTSSTTTNVSGTAAAQPSEPDIDPGSQLKLGIVLVTAASTEPADDTELLFAEGVGSPTEWDWTTSGSGFTVSSLLSPRTGTKSIDGTTVAAGAYAQGQIGSGTFDPNDFTYLVLYVKSKGTWASNRGLTVTLRSGGSLVGTGVNINRTGTFGFVSSNTTDYQQVAIPTTLFNIGSGLTITQVRIADFGGSISFYLDDLQFQGAVVTPSSAGLYAPISSAFAVIGSADSTLPNERRLVAGSGVTLTDGGAGSTLTIAATATGSGDVTGPASATDNAITRYDSTTGKLIQNSGITIADGASGTLSGTNTGDQTITLTGNVTGTGTGSFAATIANDAVTTAKILDANVTLAKMANLADSTIIGRAAAAGSGVPTALTAAQVNTILSTVVGPGSSTDNAFVRFDSTTGKLVQNSTNATLDDSGRALFKTIRMPLFDAGNSGTSKTIDWNDSNDQLLTLTGNVTLTLSNPGDGGRYVLALASGAGSFTVTWPAAVHWPAATTPTITATASKYDLVTLLYLSTAGIYLASINQNYSA